MKYYILTLKWTHKSDLLFTLWRTNARGYTWFKGQAGIYSESEARIHESDTSVKIPVDVADQLWTSVMYEGKVQKGIPLNEYTFDQLGLKPDQMLQGSPSNTSGIEFVLDEVSGLPNDITTKHRLDFMAGDPDRDEWIPYKVGTVEGRFRHVEDAVEILTIFNSEPGNGHLEDVFEWFEYAAKASGKKLRLLEVCNERFEQHLIGKRDFVPVNGKLGQFGLEKTFQTEFKIGKAPKLQAPKAIIQEGQNKPL